jgi:predicted DNA-binding WGR domain protein
MMTAQWFTQHEHGGFPIERAAPTRNVNRFYVVDVTPTLYCEWAVMREWGRRGSPGTMRLSSYRRREEAQIAEQRTIKRRLQHGYRDRNVFGACR